MESKARSEVRKLTEFESLFLQIIEYSNQVTDENFQEYAELGFNLLRRIHHLGIKETQVYERFFTYYNSLQDGMIKEWFAEMLDYISGWCHSEKYLWNNQE